MDERLLDQAYRKQLIEEIKGTENQERLQNSQEEWDVYAGNIRPYVEQKICDRFNAELVKEIPIVSSINILKKVVDSRASLYKGEPTRDFTDLSEEQEEAVELIYRDMRTNFSLLESNKLYELQKLQTHLLIEPKNGKLVMRPVKAHQLNVVPDHMDPETGEVYIFSAYNEMVNTNKASLKNQNNVNEKIADVDDYQAAEDRFIVWSKEYHFVMDGNGLILNEDIESPLASEGVMPVVPISAMKDFTYWREETNDVAEFCVDYNVHQSMLGQIVETQGFAQAFLKAPSNLMPSYINVGPNRILKLVTDPNNPDSNVEFGYATPNSDIAGAQAYNESLLAQFLSSQGLETTSISGQASTDKFSSGTERLLAQIEKFDASKETMAIYRDAEAEIYKIVKAWHNVLKGTGLLLSKYETTDFPEDSEVIVKYKEPQHMLSEMERLDIAERKMDMGIYDKIDAIAFLEEIPRDQAEELIPKEGDILVEPNVETEVIDEENKA